jgi:hypothetical protein
MKYIKSSKEKKSINLINNSRILPPSLDKAIRKE